MAKTCCHVVCADSLSFSSCWIRNSQSTKELPTRPTPNRPYGSAQRGGLPFPQETLRKHRTANPLHANTVSLTEVRRLQSFRSFKWRPCSAPQRMRTLASLSCDAASAPSTCARTSRERDSRGAETRPIGSRGQSANRPGCLDNPCRGRPSWQLAGKLFY